MRTYFIIAACLGIYAANCWAGGEPTADWVDADTGHRVIRLSTQGGSGSLYFHQNTYTPKGDKLIFDTPKGIGAVDLTKLGAEPPKVDIVVEGQFTQALATSRKAPEVYFIKGGALFAANIETHVIRQVYYGRPVTAISCDESWVVQTINATDPTGKVEKPPPKTVLPQRERMFGDKIKAGIALTDEEEKSAKKEDNLARQIANPRSQAFVFTNVKTGESRTNGYQYAWLNHLQFSPTDPDLLLYCHEGTWHEVDRIWTVRTDGSEQRLMHKRTMDMEIAGHEFWGFDGGTIWFDLQTPRSKEFWLAGVDIKSGKETRYKLERDWWSVHFNVSRDGKLFCGDGGDPGQVAFAKDGMWINLFTPQPDGTVIRERLVNMAKHNYTLEPNVTFTPDGKWVVFRSNMQGPRHVYAVEVAKAKK